MRAKFSPQIINQLRDRVIRFNEALPDASREASLIKLQNLKGLYKRWYGGKDPHAHALHKIDEHLEALGKAQAPFNPGEHPRDGSGQFAGGQAGHYKDVATSAQHRALADSNAGYDAAQTQVIPETRYSTLMPLGLAAGVTAYGGYTGATAGIKGSAIDRLQHRVARVGGSAVGRSVGEIVAAPIAGAARATRGGIGMANRHLHTTYRRPGPNTAAAIRRVIVDRSGRIVGAGAEMASHAQVAVVTGPAILARKGMTMAFGPGRFGRGAGRVGGAITGAVLAGSLLAPSVYRAGQGIGGYLDAAFPRRVRKQLEELMDAPEVLAKQEELLGDELAKANIGAAVRGVAAATRGLGGRAAQLVARLRPRTLPAVAAPAAPTSIGGAAAHSTFGVFGAKPEAQGGGFRVGRNIVGRIGAAAGPTASLGIFGAGTGAIAGAAGVGAHDYLFADKHPRDPHGRFATKTHSAKLGAIVGGAIGTGAGLAVGLAAARTGHTNLLRAALQRLGTAAPAMHTTAESEARNIHARTFFEHRPNRKLMAQNAFGADEVITHDKIKTSLEAHAGDVWTKTEGQALRDGPVSWYKHQLGAAFDKAAFPALRDATDSAGNKTPLMSKAGQPITGGNIRDLRNRVDPNPLNAGQRKIWDDFTNRHDNEVEKLQGIYEARHVQHANLQSEIHDLAAEGKKLDDDLGSMTHDAMELEHGGAKLADIRSFAQRRLGHTIKARTAPDALNELKVAIQAWTPEAEARSAEIQDALPHMRDATKNAMEAAIRQDVSDTERMSIVNPFAGGRRAQYLQPMPDYTVAKKTAEAEGSREFVRMSNIHAGEAKAHLDTLIATNQAALEARVPQVGIFSRAFHHAAPILAAHVSQGAREIRAVNAASKAGLTDTQKSVFDWLHMDKTPTEAWHAIRTLANAAVAYGGKAKDFTLANWQPITTITGLAGAVGAVDIAGPKGKRINVNPSKWKRPVGLKVVHDRPAGKPNEALLGLSYRDKDNQEKFLHGIHITSEKGAHTEIPFGTEVNAYRNQMRSGGSGGGGGGSQTRADPLPLKDKAGVDAALKQAEQHIETVGPADATFRQRKVGVGTGQKEAEDVMTAYRDAHIKFLDQRAKPDTGSNNPVYFWKSVDGLFSGSPMQLLTNSQRAALIIGDRNRRGIFGNPGGVFQGNDKTKMADQLVRQIGVHPPTEERQFRRMKQALWTAAEHLNLSGAEKTRLDAALTKSYENAGKPRPETAQAGSGGTGAAGSRGRVEDVEREILREFPNGERADDYVDDDGKLREAARKTYLRHVGIYQGQGFTSQSEIYDRALADTISSLRIVVAKLAPEGSLRKFLTRDVPRTPKIPRIAGAGTMPDINPVATPSASIAGAAAPKRNLATRIDATHQLSQAGSYGLSQGGYNAIAALASKFIPGAGIASKTARFVLPSAAGFGGAIYAGPKIGRSLGQSLGDKTAHSGNEAQGDGEAAVRSLGGAGAQLGADWALRNTAAGRGLEHAAGNALSNTASRAIGPAGRRVAGAVGNVAGRATNAVGGTVGRAFGVVDKATGALGSVTGRIAGAAGRGIAGATSNVAGKIGGAAARTATAGAFERVGAKVGGWLGGGVGAVAGTAAEPGGGTEVGGIGGKIAGTAIGAGAGWLADEGIGLLYRHLGHYGQHVPKMAAGALGHKAPRTGARA